MSLGSDSSAVADTQRAASLAMIVRGQAIDEVPGSSGAGVGSTTSREYSAATSGPSILEGSSRSNSPCLKSTGLKVRTNGSDIVGLSSPDYTPASKLGPSSLLRPTQVTRRA